MEHNLTCPKCGYSHKETSKFCLQCGAPLSSAMKINTAKEGSASFRDESSFFTAAPTVLRRSPSFDGQADDMSEKPLMASNPMQAQMPEPMPMSAAVPMPEPVAMPEAVPMPEPVAMPETVPMPVPMPIPEQPIQENTMASMPNVPMMDAAQAYPYGTQPYYGEVNMPIPQVPQEYEPLGAWAFWGYSLLFSIPVVGLICILIFSFADGNICRKNYARAYLIVIIASIVLVVLFALLGVNLQGLVYSMLR